MSHTPGAQHGISNSGATAEVWSDGTMDCVCGRTYGGLLQGMGFSCGKCWEHWTITGEPDPMIYFEIPKD